MLAQLDTVDLLFPCRPNLIFQLCNIVACVQGTLGNNGSLVTSLATLSVAFFLCKLALSLQIKPTEFSLQFIGDF